MTGPSAPAYDSSCHGSHPRLLSLQAGLLVWLGRAASAGLTANSRARSVAVGLRRLLDQGSTLWDLLREARGPLPPALLRGVSRELLLVCLVPFFWASHKCEEDVAHMSC